MPLPRRSNICYSGLAICARATDTDHPFQYAAHPTTGKVVTGSEDQQLLASAGGT